MAEPAAPVLAAWDGERLEQGKVTAFIADKLAAEPLDGARVCVLIPDATRSCPLPLLLDAVHGALAGRVAALTFLVALGTHQPLPDDGLAALLGCPPGGVPDRYPAARVRQHAWWDPGTLVTLGTLPAARVREISGDRLAVPVEVRANRAVTDHDVVLIVGPVFPHEVVGFSGGNKYLFPGVSGPEMIDVSHWLSALIGCSRIIGTPGVTPVRALLDAAAALVPARRLALPVVVEPGDDALASIAFGTPEAAWASAAEVAARTHVRYLDRPVRRVLSLVSGRYPELWTAAKGIYKVEPVVADGGEIVLYGPGLAEVSGTHGAEIGEVGYHCLEYFTGQWDRYRDHSWGVLAHAVHVRGRGTWSAAGGERCRVTVTLATGLDEGTVRSLGLGYRNPAAIDVSAWRADPGTLVVPDAGETLYRLRG